MLRKCLVEVHKLVAVVGCGLGVMIVLQRAALVEHVQVIAGRARWQALRENDVARGYAVLRAGDFAVELALKRAWLDEASEHRHERANLHLGRRVWQRHDLLDDRLVILDDIAAGADARGWITDKLYHIIERRLVSTGPQATVITANLSIENLAEMYDQRIASRLIRQGTDKVIEVDVTDFALRGALLL